MAERAPREDETALETALALRLGLMHAQARLGIEADHEHQRALGGGRNLLHLENSRLARLLIRGTLKACGLYRRGQRNALAVQTREHRVPLARLPDVFEGYRILHLSDLHLDENPAVIDAVARLVEPLDYDLCVLTGDYRVRTSGPVEPTIRGMARLRPHLGGPVYAVLGNHDSVRMVPGLEALDVRMLMNENVPLTRGDARIHLMGVDDPHYYRTDNLEKAVAGVPARGVRILLSHTPELYRQAAHFGCDLFLCGHTHGGQICLPGGIPVILEADIPRRLGAHRWEHAGMIGYTSTGAGTSTVHVRYNCPGEITIHRLERA